jgi:hypothetical protein
MLMSLEVENVHIRDLITGTRHSQESQRAFMSALK